MKICFVDNYYVGQPSHKFDELTDYAIMSEYGIELVTKFSQADLIIAFKLDCEIIFSNKPVILCERYDSVSVGTVPKSLAHPKVLKIFKDFVARDLTIYEKPTVKKRFHYGLLEAIYKTGETQVIQDLSEHVHKLRLIPWGVSQYSHLYVSKHMKYCIDNQHKFNGVKDIDIFCVCHLHPDIQLLHQHRTTMMKIVDSLSSDYTVFCTTNISSKDYHDSMIRSRVVVSPWGIGERVAADQKALLSNCILIKPDSDFVQTEPDLYSEQYYVKCNIDLSNLEQVCREVLENYDVYFERTQKARDLLSSYDLERYTRIFWKDVSETML